jgi:putative addiction module component (TIGR02574 family)
MTTDQLEQEVLKLPTGQRARLAERIIASLDAEAEIEHEWLAEVKRRDAELDTGAVEAIPMEDALTSARERLGW